MVDLIQSSLDILLTNQHASGAFIASPNFPPYRYCWFRDGSYIAYALDIYGEYLSAARFQDWACKVILARADAVKRVVDKISKGNELVLVDTLHTRYTFEGQESPEEWPNFQLDGFGTWLWSLAEHCRRADQAPCADWSDAADLIADYLTALWKKPCFDCWEEFPDKIHAYTLASIRGGLEAWGSMSGNSRTESVEEIDAFIRSKLLGDGYFVKFLGSCAVDASLLGLATPYRCLDPKDPLMRTTVARIEAQLMNNGGLHRYRADSYYGGGEWVLLTAWLGWYDVECGRVESARQHLRWVEAQADKHGHLPEQISKNLNNPDYLQPWRERWGDIANPLLWSHAKYLILRHALSTL